MVSGRATILLCCCPLSSGPTSTLALAVAIKHMAGWSFQGAPL